MKEKRCLNCGESLEEKIEVTKYCSINCCRAYYNKKRKRLRALMIKDREPLYCKYCKEQLTGQQKKCCSRDECKEVFKKELSKESYKKQKLLKEKKKEIIYCKYCGKELEGNQKIRCGSKKCSKDYQREWDKIEYKEHKKAVIKDKGSLYCEYCKKELIEKQRKFCSINCGSKYRLKIIKELREKKVFYCTVCGEKIISKNRVCCNRDSCKKEYKSKDNKKYRNKNKKKIKSYFKEFKAYENKIREAEKTSN